MVNTCSLPRTIYFTSGILGLLTQRFARWFCTPLSFSRKEEAFLQLPPRRMCPPRARLSLPSCPSRRLGAMHRGQGMQRGSPWGSRLLRLACKGLDGAEDDGARTKDVPGCLGLAAMPPASPLCKHLNPFVGSRTLAAAGQAALRCRQGSVESKACRGATGCGQPPCRAGMGTSALPQPPASVKHGRHRRAMHLGVTRSVNAQRL